MFCKNIEYIAPILILHIHNKGGHYMSYFNCQDEWYFYDDT